jgi:hypothetical protein
VSIAVGNFNSDSHPDLVTANSGSNDVSILINNTFVYARPKGASPTSVSLVPAYRSCTSANANEAHGLPLAYPSCSPPVQTSRYLSVGTPDANGAPANSMGSARFTTIAGDLRIDTSITDVRCYPGIVTTCGVANAAGGADYTGEVQLTAQLRSSDTYNGEFGGVSSQPATAQDTSFPVTVPCAETPGDDSIGGACTMATTANAVVPGVLKAGVRTVWQLGQIQVLDGGFDGDVSTKGEGDGVFEVQGVFVP